MPLYLGVPGACSPNGGCTSTVHNGLSYTHNRWQSCSPINHTSATCFTGQPHTELLLGQNNTFSLKTAFLNEVRMTGLLELPSFLPLCPSTHNSLSCCEETGSCFWTPCEKRCAHILITVKWIIVGIHLYRREKQKRKTLTKSAETAVVINA